MSSKCDEGEWPDDACDVDAPPASLLVKMCRRLLWLVGVRSSDASWEVLSRWMRSRTRLLGEGRLGGTLLMVGSTESASCGGVGAAGVNDMMGCSGEADAGDVCWACCGVIE